MNMATCWDKPTVRHGYSQCPWMVFCHCGSGFGMVAWSKDWRTAQDWATKHAAEHEAIRCKTCGRLP